MALRSVIVTFLLAIDLLGFYLPNPVALSMGEAMTAYAHGINCLGYNPANLALNEQGHINILLASSVNFSLSNNAFSLEDYSAFAGKNAGVTGKNNQGLIAELVSDECWESFSIMNIPLFKISFGNKAISSEYFYLTEYGLSKDFIEVLFGEMEKGRDYKYEISGNEFIGLKNGLSIGFPVGNICLGVSVYYIQGLAGIKIDPDKSNGYIKIDTSKFVISGSGSFVLDQYIGAEGFSSDIGVLFPNFFGWRIGLSIINVGGILKLNVPTFISMRYGEIALKKLGDSFNRRNNVSDLDFDGSTYSYEFIVREVNGQKIIDSDSSISDFFVSKREVKKNNTTPLERIPLVLRFGVSNKWERLILNIDLISTFGDGYLYKQGWQLACGAEFNKVLGFPIRTGLNIGGYKGVALSVGSIVKIGFINIDWAIAFHRGLFIHKIKGIDFGLSISINK